jgi:hypothetical protein
VEHAIQDLFSLFDSNEHQAMTTTMMTTAYDQGIDRADRNEEVEVVAKVYFLY